MLYSTYSNGLQSPPVFLRPRRAYLYHSQQSPPGKKQWTTSAENVLYCRHTAAQSGAERERDSEKEKEKKQEKHTHVTAEMIEGLGGREGGGGETDRQKQAEVTLEIHIFTERDGELGGQTEA